MGSLFQLRDFWSTSFPGEEFSPSAVVLADPDVSNLFDKIVLGSYQGMLRILNPSATQGPMLPGDVLLEKKYDEPILQLDCGPFRPFKSGVPPNILAVLFPRTLMFLEIAAHGSDNANAMNAPNPTSSGTAGNELAAEVTSSSTPDAQLRHRYAHGSSSNVPDTFSSLKELGAFYTLTVQSEARLLSTAYNFACGCFGNSDYKMVCVQSMDGSLTILDYGGVLYRTFLPQNQFLIPGPMQYSMHRDALLTCNTSMFLLSYSFSSLVLNSTAEDVAATTAGAVAASRFSSLCPLWTFNLGEDAVDIAVCRLTRGLTREEADVVVLCTSALYVLSESGEPRMIRRLDVEASALCVYPLPGIQYDNLLVGTFNGLVQVYSDTELQWSAAVSSGAAPLQLTVATLCGVEGMIVNLASDSSLSINYLGTDPVDQLPESLETKSIPYTEIVNDLKQYEQLIHGCLGDAASATEDGDEDDPLAIPGKPLSFMGGKSKKKRGAGKAEEGAASSGIQTAAAPSRSTAAAAASLFITSAFSSIRTTDNSAELTVTLQTLHNHVEAVSLVLQAVPPLLATPCQCVIEQITPESSVQRTFTVHAIQDRDLIIPSSLDVVVVAVYRGQRREYETVQHVALAPFPLVARPVAPAKNTAFSLQLNTDQSQPPSLIDVFADMAPLGHVTGNVLSLHYLNGADATVLVSKNAARFKLQGSTMEGLWLLAAELTRRLRLCCGGAAALKLEVADDLPVPDFLAVVDTHWAIRREMVAASAALDDAAALFRAVEKRLLARFRDRSPADATALGVLFQEGYKLLRERADAVTRAKTRMRQASAMLNCCAQLFWFCLKIKSPLLAPEDAETLSTLFRCSVADDNDGGWEEVTEAVLAKVLNVKTKKVASNNLELSSSTANLKKHIGTLISMVQSGQKLGSATEGAGA
ncbi:conserved hypothetical protein [Leishmania infantum JPCM5]|uniref:PTHB1_N-terminus/PTHB1_C-terminus_-_putative n=2 Tax=Leishmania infantum TaxID=5671 RepID=A0A6L0XLS3_LEIIN|nr:conserved hypothetical protein [Leishmania infantum JPCM5]CAC9524347.1 PTHB1_N-terminus/PTHB1_C-terminus_-_putative [Leishmania infantum]CAM70877.1 conserved hypothetical protein [Leishmania infantum JPCM5]SUZ44695.1 PTHB1_N-terminus/PTHB1_C-terminus_-_putative [Leishmania infantum]|eukprot:XP_001467810.1 conserved hypothetical protein [Leishmania infantum JPCM5]